MAAATTTFHAPQSTSEFECVISLRVADACGHQNVVMQTTTIVPTQPPQIGKTQDLQYLLPGEIVTYSLDVNYTGVVGLINGRVIDPIPEYTTYVSNSVNAGGMYNAASNRVTWEIGSNTGAVEGIVRESSTHTNELNPWMDVTIDQADPTVNFDSVDELHTDPNATQQERVLMRWGLWEIPGGADIHRADLRLYIETARVNHTNEFHWLTRRWTEDDVTWNTFDGATAWTTPGGDFDAQVEASFLPDTVGARTISVSNLVQNWIDGVWPNYGLIMDGQGVDSPAVYSSKEHATELQRPLLTVEYTIASNITVNTLSAQPLIITSNGQITVTMDVNVPGVHTNVDVTPPVALGVVSNNLGGLTLLSGPTPSGPVTLTAGGQTNFTWKYDVTAGDMPGYVGFYGTPTSSVTFAEAGTDLTLVLPVFSFQVQVVTNLPDHITAIYNQAYLSDDNTFSQPVVVESPEVEVYIPRLESYQDDYSTIENLYRRDPDDTGQGDDTIYVGGNGFDSNATYYVVYYDAAGDFVYTDTNAFTVGTNRFLKSYYANTNDSIDYGTWTAVAMPEGTTPDPVLRDHS